MRSKISSSRTTAAVIGLVMRSKISSSRTTAAVIGVRGITIIITIIISPSFHFQTIMRSSFNMSIKFLINQTLSFRISFEILLIMWLLIYASKMSCKLCEEALISFFDIFNFNWWYRIDLPMSVNQNHSNFIYSYRDRPSYCLVSVL
jgi:hypothetical protein